MWLVALLVLFFPNKTKKWQEFGQSKISCLCFGVKKNLKTKKKNEQKQQKNNRDCYENQHRNVFFTKKKADITSFFIFFGFFCFFFLFFVFFVFFVVHKTKNSEKKQKSGKTTKNRIHPLLTFLYPNFFIVKPTTHNNTNNNNKGETALIFLALFFF